MQHSNSTNIIELSNVHTLSYLIETRALLMGILVIETSINKTMRTACFSLLERCLVHIFTQASKSIRREQKVKTESANFRNQS